MELPQIKALIDAMAASDLAEMEFSQDGWTLRLRRALSTPTTPSVDAPPLTRPAFDLDLDLVAPLHGIVHLQPAPGEPAFVTVGQAVEAGRIVCVIEAMKVFHQVCAERDGVVAAVLVATGQEVEAGQPLLRFAEAQG